MAAEAPRGAETWPGGDASLASIRYQTYNPAMPDDDKPVVEVTGDKLPVAVDVTVKGVHVRVVVTLQKRNDAPADPAQTAFTNAPH